MASISLRVEGVIQGVPMPEFDVVAEYIDVRLRSQGSRPTGDTIGYGERYVHGGRLGRR